MLPESFQEFKNMLRIYKAEARTKKTYSYKEEMRVIGYIMVQISVK